MRERSHNQVAPSKWKSAIDIWYVRFYLEAIGSACRVEGRGFEPRCGTFFPPSSFFFLLSFFSLSFFFFSHGFLFFSSPFHYPFQARSATSMLKHFSSYIQYTTDRKSPLTQYKPSVSEFS